MTAVTIDAFAYTPPVAEIQVEVAGPTVRVPGTRFRHLVELLLEREPDLSRAALARVFRDRLEQSSIDYHERTIKRQMTGSVSTVPPECEAAAITLLLERGIFESRDAVESELSGVGLHWASDEAQSPYIRAERVMPVIQLWLFLNPNCSKRSLASRLRNDLSQMGFDFALGSLESSLAGNAEQFRRELLDLTIGYLGEHGYQTEAEAQAAAADQNEEIQQALEFREFVDNGRFQQLCRVWQLRNGEASARRLASLLQARLTVLGMPIGLHRLQKIVCGRTRRVRRAVEFALEELLKTELPPELTLDDALHDVAMEPSQSVNLYWVKAQPIAELAQKWLSENAGMSMRQLAVRVATTIQTMGFSTSHNTIQPILGGWKKKTRGFVYRALLAQFGTESEQEIPSDHILEPNWKLEPEPALDDPAPTSSVESTDSPTLRLRAEVTLEGFIEKMKHHLPSAKSEQFLAFAAYRAEQLFGIARARARDLIAA